MRVRTLKTTDQPRKKRITRHAIHKLSTLSEDELFCIFLLLDFQTIFNMKQISRRFKKSIEHILEKMKFWNHFPELNITSTDIARSISTGGYKNLMEYSTKIFEKNLLEDATIYPYYKKNVVLSFFNGKNIYQNCAVSLVFSTIQPLILRDQASTFFRKISRLGDLIPFIQEDNFDLVSVLRVLEKFDNSFDLMIADLNFIGLLPNLIKYNAPRCFDLLIRAYIACHAWFARIERTEHYALNDVRHLILREGNNHYIQRFIDIIIKLYPVNSNQSILYQEIQFFSDNNMIDMVHQSLQKIPDQRKNDILNEWNKLDMYSNILWKLYSGEKYRYNLKTSLEKALEFVKSNPHISIQDLIDHQENINTSFHNFVEIFHSNKESFFTI